MAETIIVGAGPYGLSLAAYLAARHLPFEIVGEPMAAWRRHMPRNMLIKSEPFATNLSDPARAFTLERFCELRGASYEPVGNQIPLYKFLSYADWFQQQAKLDVHDRRLIRLSRAAARFELDFADGTRASAQNVVLATGLVHFRWSPPLLADLPAELASHTADHADLSCFAGRDVTIVGCGQSGLETAALLHEHGATVRVLARAPQILWTAEPPRRSAIGRVLRPENGLGSGWQSWIYAEHPWMFYRLPARLRTRIVTNGWGPAGTWWLKDRVVGKVRLLTEHEIIGAQERQGRLRLIVRAGRDTVAIDTDHVIAATGYKVDLDRLPFLDPALRVQIACANGAPQLSPRFESSVSGLYFIGMASAQNFGPAMRFMFGAKHPARIISQHLAAQSAKASPVSRPFRHAPESAAQRLDRAG